MAAALKASGARTKKAAVELGLKTLIQLSKQGEIKRLRGKIAWERDLEAMRRDEWPLFFASRIRPRPV